MIRVVVTEPEYSKGRAVFDAQPEMEFIPCSGREADVAATIQQTKARYVVVGVEKYIDALYASLPEGGLIARFGVGHDGINKKLAEQKGLYCTNTPGVLDESVAECTVGLLLSVARNFAQCSQAVGGGKWQPVTGLELSRKRLAVIGCGNIGRRVAEIAAKGFGMAVCGNDVVEPDDTSAFEQFTTDFNTAVHDADFISLHIPGIPQTENFIDALKLAAMKKGAILVNTSRGSVVDESALYDAVASGHLRGVGLDVYRNEPYTPVDQQKDLRQLEAILMTPHIGSNTTAACTRMAKSVIRNILYRESGQISHMDCIV